MVPAMRDRGWGRIVNVSSGVGSLAEMGCWPPGYSASKAALNALTRLLAPDSLTVLLSITLFVGLVVGGVASIARPVFGGAFIAFLSNVAEEVSKAAPGAVCGVVLIAFIFLLPSGVAGGLGRLLRRAARRPA